MFRVTIGEIFEIFWDDGKENGSYYGILPLYRVEGLGSRASVFD